MIQLSCNRLLVNDTRVSKANIVECLGSDSETYGIEVIDISDIADAIRNRAISLIWRADMIILPGRSARIFMDSTGIKIPEFRSVYLPSVRRKLEWLTPRWIGIDRGDSQRLDALKNATKILLIDDVVASGTTVNGITKRLWRNDIDILTLVSRDPTDLRSPLKDRLNAWCRVGPKSQRIPAINTLSSLQDPEKEWIVLSWFRRLYGERFSQRISSLFSYT